MENFTSTVLDMVNTTWMSTVFNNSWLNSTMESVYFFPPVYYLMIFVQLYMDLMMDRMVLVFTAFLMGMSVMFAIESFIIYTLYKRSPILPPPVCEYKNIELPESLKSRITQPNLKQKEDCVWLNFLLQFLFHELKDSLNVRRFITKKIQVEFEELLKSKSGVFVDELFLRDFHLGDKFPVIMSMSLDNVDVQDNIIQTIDLKAKLVYDGGLKIAIDAALPLATTAYISVKVVKIRGVARFQFSMVPYTHWSVSFYEEPELELDVTAQLDGRMMPKLKNIIANQIKRIVRKKHTLPMYKMRFKPFFPPHIDLSKETNQRLHLNGTEIGCGILELTVVECSQLSFVARDSKLYCVISLDKVPWKQLMAEKRSTKKEITFELVKSSADSSVGFLVKDEIWDDRLQSIVIVDEVTVGSPAHLAGVLEGDILIGANDIKITSAKQSVKCLKWGKDNRLKIQIEREIRCDAKLDFMGFNRRASSWHSEFMMAQETEKKEGHEVNSRLSCTTVKEADKADSNVRHTVYKPGCENPRWNQKFIFSVDSNHQFLNLCVWCRGGDRSDKPEIIKWSKNDVLIGFVSLNLDDIYLHCLMTLNGRLRDRFKLKHGHYKTEAELMKIWSIHKGWDPNQMYGNIHLEFCFHPYFLTSLQRRSLASCRTEAVQLQNELFERSAKASVFKDSSAKSGKRKEGKGHHQFDSANFTTATFCDFCGKKIWMKEAFKCKICHMVCHKKCLAKCLINTVCSEGGAQKRVSLDQYEPWVPLNDPGKLKPPGERDSFTSEKTVEEEERDGSVSDMQLETRQLLESLYNIQPLSSKAWNTDTLMNQSSGTTNRFTVLKEQTEKMKDNVMKHLKKNNKASTILNDKSIINAKDTGAKLFAEMDPLLRRDKLDELVRKLDEQIKLEMQNKDSLEKELSNLEASDKKSSTPKLKSDIKALHNKALKSGEKLDAMSLLMLQYCSALQICLNALESEEIDKLSTMSDTEKLKTSGSPKSPSGSPKLDGKSAKSTVGGFVRRAGTTVKEKVTSMKRDFGRKGKSDKSGSPGSTTQLSNNNTALLNVPDNDDLVLVVSSKTQIDIIQQSKSSENLQSSTELSVDISHAVTDILTDSPETKISYRQDDIDSLSEIAEAGDTTHINKHKKLSQNTVSLTRSNSDSELEVIKMLSHSPEEILRYRGNSLPKILLDSDSDSDSDFLLIESTDDEPAGTDSSDNEATFPTDHKMNITDVAKIDIDKHGASEDSDPEKPQYHISSQVLI